MEEDEDQVEVEEMAADVRSQLMSVSRAHTPAMAQLASIQEKRQARLQKAESRLSERLGTDHPRVVALRHKGSQAETLSQRASAAATFAAKVPDIKPYESLVYGRVMTPKGKPLAGLRVRVFDKDRSQDDLLGFTETDDGGHFFLVFHQRAFMEPGENKPELYVQVETKRGKVLYSSEKSLRTEAGRYEYFEIAIDQKRAVG